MSTTNKACRDVGDVDIRVLSTMKPYLYFDTANSVGLSISSEDTFAMAKGSKAIAFSNPMDSTVTIEGQVLPSEFYAMLSDGTIETSAVLAEKETVICTVAGTLTVPSDIKAGTLFVYASGSYAGTPIAGTLAGTTFTATAPADIAVDASYDIGYLVTKSTGVKKVTFNDTKNPLDYYITMRTTEKSEDGILSTKKITIFKGKPTKALDITYSSEGDPVSVSMTINCLRDKQGNIIEMVEED